MLEGWAWRIHGWENDHDGESLSVDQVAALQDVLLGAAKTAAASYDLPTVLKLLRDYFIMQEGVASAIDDNPEFNGVLAQTEATIIASAIRITDVATGFRASTGLMEIDRLLRQISRNSDSVVSTLRTSKGITSKMDDTTTDKFQKLLSKIRSKIDPSIFADKGMDGTISTTNVILAGFTKKELFGFLDESANVFGILETEGLATSAVDAPPEFPILEFFRESQIYLAPAINADAALAVSANESLSSSFTDYVKLRQAISDHAGFYRLHAKVGETFTEEFGSFNPRTSDLIDAFIAKAKTWLPRLDPTIRAEHHWENINILGDIASSINGDLLSVDETINPIFAQLQTYNDSVRNVVLPGEYCDELAAQLRLLDYPIPRTPGNAVNGESLHLIKLTGQYDSAPGEPSPVETLQVNQAGRYLEGWIQVHSKGLGMNRFRLSGMLESDSDTEIVFAILRFDDDDVIVGAGRLIAREVGGKLAITFEDRERDSGDLISTVDYVQTGNAPTLSDSLLDIFSGEEREIVEAQHRAPFHNTEVDLINSAVEDSIIEVDDYFGGDLADRLTEALQLDNVVEDLLAQLSIDQIPLLRAWIREALSRIPREESNQSYWELAVMIFNNHRGVLPSIAKLLGIVPAEIGSAEMFSYEFMVTLAGASVDVPVPVLPLGAGAFFLDVEVTKTILHDLADQDDDERLPSWKFKGAIGQIGLGYGAPISTTTSTDVIKIRTPFNYTQQDIQGGISVVTLGAGLSYFAGEGVGVTTITIFPEGEKSPICLDPGWTSELEGFQASIGIDFSFGYLAVEGEEQKLVQTLGDSLVKFSAQAEVQGQEAVAFNSGKFDLLDCGWQTLREYLAEYRYLTNSSGVEIAIFGFTDTVGSESVNLLLSQNRADAVKAALQKIDGGEIGVAEAKIKAFGLGELPARELSLEQLDDFEDLKRFGVTIAKYAIAIGKDADEVPNPEWRRVIVVINKVVFVELNQN